MYWSCLPIGSFRMSISISHASSARRFGDARCPVNAYSAFRSPTVRADEEPRPVPLDGMSAIVVTSMLLVIPTFLRHSLTMPCSILLRESAISVLE